jgi:hypothetical protein
MQDAILNAHFEHNRREKDKNPLICQPTLPVTMEGIPLSVEIVTENLVLEDTAPSASGATPPAAPPAAVLSNVNALPATVPTIPQAAAPSSLLRPPPVALQSVPSTVPPPVSQHVPSTVPPPTTAQSAAPPPQSGPTQDDIDRLKNELKASLDEEQGLITKQIDLLTERQLIKTAIEKSKTDAQLAALVTQKEMLEQLTNTVTSIL